MDVSGFKQVATIYYKAILYHGQDTPKHGSVTAVGVKKSSFSQKEAHSGIFNATEL